MESVNRCLNSSKLDSLVEEFTHETQTARRHLERIPEAHFNWHPYAKSFTIRQLGGHIIECVRWAEQVLANDESDMNPAAYEAIRPDSVTSLLEVFDAMVEGETWAMASSTVQDVTQPWRMKLRGETLFEKNWESAFRDLSMNHLIHLWSQFTVYLRLLDVPLVGTYEPTADQRG